MFLRRPAPETVAAVDLGSNSFHMIVARLEDGQLRIVDRLREPVRLAAGIDDDDRIKPEARLTALECLARFGQRVRDLPQGGVRAVGTNTLRRADNAGDFIAEAAAALGHPVEVIGGHEEARLIYLGVAHSLGGGSCRRLVVDIGGGSTEIIVGERFDPILMESLYMGCVGMTERHFPKGTITAEGWKAAELAARLELQPIEREYRKAGWRVAVGASGTLLAIAEVVRASGWSQEGITPEVLSRLKQILLKAGHADRIDLPGLSRKRAEVFAGGVVIISAVFSALGIERMGASDGALREGLIYDLLGRIQHEDVRSAAVGAFMGRFRVDAAHAASVERVAIGLLEAVGGEWVFDEEDADLLRWAARLHEVGLALSHGQYHKHGAYLVENADLSGFSREEQWMLSLLVRAHRRKFPLSLFAEVPAPRCDRAARLAVLLRMAVLLQRNRANEAVPVRVVSAEPTGMTIAFDDGWLDANPLTRADLAQEAEWLKAAKFALRCL